MKIFKNWTFKWWEMGMLKVSLISLGIILGINFFPYLVGLMWLWWLLFVVFALYFLVGCFKKG